MGQTGLKLDTMLGRSETTPGRGCIGGQGNNGDMVNGNPFRTGLWNADVVSVGVGGAEEREAEIGNYYEPTTAMFVHQHL